MRILVLADIESKNFYDFYSPGKLDPYDLIISCGDLDAEYLEFLVTFAHCPLLYVHGNHDEAYVAHEPEGCICIDDRLYEYRGVRFVGLGGCHKYRPGPYMYTERKMAWRIGRLLPSIWLHHGFDVLVTHAPARHVNDFDTPTHMGFECFGALLEKFHPRYFLHGHIHRNYGVKIPRMTVRGDTTVINAFEYYEFEY